MFESITIRLIVRLTPIGLVLAIAAVLIVSALTWFAIP